MGAIRLFLAIAVMLEHFDQQVLFHRDLPFDISVVGNTNGARAVLLFYVISGFLISYALREKYTADFAGTLSFYKSRFLRIYPLWWILLAISVALSSAPRSNFIPAVFLFGIDWIIPLWNYPGRYWDNLPAGTAIAWTLGAELTFYLFAPWLLRRNWIALAVFTGSFLIRVIIHSKVGAGEPTFANLTFFFFPATLMFFLLGHFAAVVSRKYQIKPILSLTLLGISIVLFSLIYPRISIDQASEYVAVICFAASLPGIFAMTKDNRISNYLGDLTYPLYITHSLTIGLLFWPIALGAGFGERMMDGYLLPNVSKVAASTILTVVILVSAIAGAIFVHALVEEPARRFLSFMISRLATAPKRDKNTGMASP